MASYYEVLKVPVNASTADIKKAYKQLALKWHPDKNPDKLAEANKNFREISKAYEVLSDETKRQTYDMRSYNFPTKRPSSDFHFYEHGRYETFNFRDPEEVFREFFRGCTCEFLRDAVRNERLTKISSSSFRLSRGPTLRRHDVGDYMVRPLFTPAHTQDSCLFGNMYRFQSAKGKSFKMKNIRVQMDD